MAIFLLGLFMLMQLPIISIAGSVAHLKDCEASRLLYSWTSDCKLFGINGQPVDNVLFCKALELSYANGCFCDTGLEELGKVGRECCSLELYVLKNVACVPYGVHLTRRPGRKFLVQRPTNESIVHNPEKKSKLQVEIHRHSSTFAPEGMPAAIPGMFLLCCSVLCPCFRARKREERNASLAKEPVSMGSVSSVDVSSTSERVPASPFRVPPSPSRFSMSPQLNRVGSMNLSISQIGKATRNFSPSLKIGEGGFGKVYKAHLRDGQIVAVKRAKKEAFEALRREFSSEVEMLAKIEHRNLVKLLCYVDQGDERIIVMEYVPNGTLREHLDGQYGKALDFPQRLEIAIDIAHGLTYLHLYAGNHDFSTWYQSAKLQPADSELLPENPIIHRDVKSSNILLTENLRAKVADFGFARIGPMELDETHISTKVKGTAGYLDPEYLRTYQLTPKSDVYSFGILLIEILSGRRPVELKRINDERVTVRWAFNKFSEGRTREILDPLLEEGVEEEILERIFGLAFQCAAPTRSDRPLMNEVTEQLWAIRRDHHRRRKSESLEI